MTREEAIKVIQHMAYLSAHVVENGVEAYEYIKQFLSKSSLPSNLDEVRLDTSDMIDCGYKAVAEYYYNLGKKAGAEWMARQGYIKEGIARPDDCEIWVNLTGTDIKDVDKVIVQIRKK